VSCASSLKRMSSQNLSSLDRRNQQVRGGATCVTTLKNSTTSVSKLKKRPKTVSSTTLINFQTIDRSRLFRSNCANLLFNRCRHRVRKKINKNCKKVKLLHRDNTANASHKQVWFRQVLNSSCVKISPCRVAV
jgi:hypothetical protein